MRGEDADPHVVESGIRGSPPHARGRRRVEMFALPEDGITPACAGKTMESVVVATWGRDHPRMRGEDVFRFFLGDIPVGSPPHARGRQLDSPGNPAKSSSSLPVFFCSQPSPLGWFLRWVLGLGLNLWKQR